MHIQKGAPNSHKVVLSEKADEVPGMAAGDVIFEIQEGAHELFKRKGADLYITKRISLVEALCGFEFEIEHLDGRTLVVRSAPGQITAHSMYDPFGEKAGDQSWETLANMRCASADVAEANTTDVELLKKAVSDGQLKDRGINCFVIHNGRAVFKDGSRAECLAAQKPTPGATMYLVADQEATASTRMMQCVVGEGLPTFRDQTEYGNLFVLFEVEFPAVLSEEAVSGLRQVLPPALNSVSVSEDDENVQVCALEQRDPVTSFNLTKPAVVEDVDEEDGRPSDIGGCAPQ